MNLKDDEIMYGFVPKDTKDATDAAKLNCATCTIGIGSRMCGDCPAGTKRKSRTQQDVDDYAEIERINKRLAEIEKRLNKIEKEKERP